MKCQYCGKQATGLTAFNDTCNDCATVLENIDMRFKIAMQDMQSDHYRKMSDVKDEYAEAKQKAIKNLHKQAAK